MPDINELAEKLKSRVRKIKKVNKSDEEKEKFCTVRSFCRNIFPNKKPEELSDSLILWTTPEGKITDGIFL